MECKFLKNNILDSRLSTHTYLCYIQRIIFGYLLVNLGEKTELVKFLFNYFKIFR